MSNRLALRSMVATLLLVLSLSFAYAANPDDWWVSITNDRARVVKQMLQQGADPNEISPMGQPAIMQAIRDDAWDVYDILLNHPNTVFNAINVNRETPLMYLAVIGDTERARELIKRGALINRKGWTALHYAASTGQIETAEMLLELGAEVNAPAPDDTTPLMMAAYAGSEPMVRLLLKAGADVNLRNRQNYDVVDWAGFKSNTILARKLRDLIDESTALLEEGSTATVTATQKKSEQVNSASGSTNASSDQSSTSRYFDLERFERSETP